jgi:drug/metabolite transporter (DMT)-like permease
MILRLLASSSNFSAHHPRGVALMFASAAAFTANVLLIRALGEMATVNVWLVTCARFVVGLGMIVAVYWKEFEPRHLFRRRKLAERGLIGATGVYIYYVTIVHLGAGRATFIGNTYVVWGALLAAWVLKERLRPAVIVGSVAALVGLALLTNVIATGARPGLYDLLAVVGALLSAYVVVTIRQLHATEHTATIFAAQCVYGLLLCAGPAVAHPQALSVGAGLLILLASLCAGAGQLMMTHAFRDLPVAEGSLIQVVGTLGTAAGGIVFFHERFTGPELVGAALVLAGTVYPAWQTARPAPARAE